jgi:predicted ATPase/transcriptional regulator with XRE-family HTH domain
VSLNNTKVTQYVEETLAEVSFGEWLKRQRRAGGLTQDQLALQINCSASALRKFESEERHPSAQVIERLAEIFNIPPNEQKAFQRFARGDSRFAPGEIIEDAPWHVSTTSPRSNLPSTTTSLIGRKQEIALVRGYLLNTDIRLVTLIGPPGIGKTRLSIEAAREALSNFADGVFFVTLALVDDSSLVALTIVQTLGYVEAKGKSAMEQLIGGIGDKQMLLVLDNFEHLIEDSAPLASGLLSACPRLKILITSREALRVPGEWLYSVPPLDIPKEESLIDLETIAQFPALTLFVERARAVCSDFVLNIGNVQTVASICRQLDGLPLAIELIAARMRLMSPQVLLTRLSDQFILSADGMRAVSARQKTLHNAIGWSYDLLSNEEQKLFARLSVFAGDFTLDAAESIFSRISETKPVTDLVASLLDKSLLQRTFDVNDEARFTMLATIQQFALEQLRKMDEETSTRNQHLAYFLDLAEKADKELRGSNQLEWLRRLELVRDNLRAALNWAIESNQTKSGLRLVRKLDWFWFVRSDHSEGRQWLQRVLGMPDTPLHPEAQAQMLNQLAHHTWLQIGADEARPFVEQALYIARAHADKQNTAWALDMLGLVLAKESNFSEAQTTLAESKILFREVHDEWGYAHAILCLGFAAFLQDDRATSIDLLEQALAGFRELGDRYFASVCLHYIGILRVRQSQLIRAAEALRDALFLVQQLGSTLQIAFVLWDFAEIAKAEGYSAHAVRLYCATRKIYDSIGVWGAENDESDFENAIAPCRAVLDESVYETAVEQGRAMTMEQAIVYALEKI